MTEFHPAAAIFPLLKGDPFDALVADIKANGLLQPITVTGEPPLILDGRNRYLACAEAGVEPFYDAYEGSDPVGFVISLNMARRQLDESQRAMCAARALSSNLNWTESIAVFCVSRGSLSYAKKVLEKGVEKLIERVDQGELAVSRAAEMLELEPETQEELASMPTPAIIIENHERVKRDKGREKSFRDRSDDDELEDRGTTVGKAVDICWKVMSGLNPREKGAAIELLRLRNVLALALPEEAAE